MNTHIPIGEASRRFGVSIDTLRRWARDGRVRCWRDSTGRRLFDEDELAAAVRPIEQAPPTSGTAPSSDGQVTS